MKQRHISGIPLPSTYSTASRRATFPHASQAQLSSRAPNRPNGPSEGVDRTSLNSLRPQLRQWLFSRDFARAGNGNGPSCACSDGPTPSLELSNFNMLNGDFMKNFLENREGA